MNAPFPALSPREQNLITLQTAGHSPAPARPPSVVEAKPATTAGDAAPPDAITIHELRDHRCHWPFGDPRESSFRYCGAAVARDREDWEPYYCARHRAIAYTPRRGSARP